MPYADRYAHTAGCAAPMGPMVSCVEASKAHCCEVQPGEDGGEVRQAGTVAVHAHNAQPRRVMAASP